MLLPIGAQQGMAFSIASGADKSLSLELLIVWKLHPMLPESFQRKNRLDSSRVHVLSMMEKVSYTEADIPDLFRYHMISNNTAIGEPLAGEHPQPTARV